MARFLKGNELNSELEKIFEIAESRIFLISPYIQLHERYKATLLTKKENPNLKIVILFGKNEDNLSKSLAYNDFDFFKQFPNIVILYEKRLHAKYYANEKKAILTSMNLYGYSQNNNIEAGILFESSLKGSFTGDNELDKSTWDYFRTVLDQAKTLYRKTPKFEKKNILSSSKFIGSDIEIDILSEFFNTKKSDNYFKRVIPSNNSKVDTNRITGYCIRTGKEIPFNLEKPMCYEAFKLWSKYSDSEYPEKFCHFSGEPSNGDTCVSRPILKKNWKKAQAKFNL